MIVEALREDSKRLTEISLMSKAYWNYTEEQISTWKEDLTIQPEIFDHWRGSKYVLDDKIVGFYLLNRVNSRTCILEFLFVEPSYIGKGIGKELIDHAIESCRENSCEVLNVLSDPNAENFYAKQGFEVLSLKESSIKGRLLPEMVLEFPENM